MENIKNKWGNRFIIAAIIQGGIITAMALIIVGIQVTFTQVNIMQFLSLSFEGPAKWFFIGTIFYLILVLAVAVTAVFYNHLEINLNRKFVGAARILAWIHIIGMNVGGTGATMLMIFAGLAGSGVLSLFSEGQLGKARRHYNGFLYRSNSIFYRCPCYRSNIRWYNLHFGIQEKNLTQGFLFMLLFALC